MGDVVPVDVQADPLLGVGVALRRSFSSAAQHVPQQTLLGQGRRRIGSGRAQLTTRPLVTLFAAATRPPG